MQYILTIGEDDFLSYYLYKASSSKKARSQMNSSWFWISLFLIVIGVLHYLHNEISFALFFGILGIILLLLYPIYQKRFYYNHFKNLVKESYAADIAVKKLELTQDQIFTESKISSSKMSFQVFVNFVETGSHVFLNTKGGNALIIPKTTVNIDKLKEELTEISERHNIPYHAFPNWKW